MKSFLPIVFLVFILAHNSFAQKWNWAKQGTFIGNDGLATGFATGEGAAVTTDKWGNAYLAGEFWDTIVFGKYILKIYDTAYDFPIGLSVIFLTKYDSAGNVIWAVQSSLPDKFSNIVYDEVASVITDSYGNIYMTGEFTDTAIFGNYSLIDSFGSSNYFLAKFDANGNVLWVRQTEAGSRYNSVSCGNSMAIDQDGYIYVAGVFTDTITFDSNWKLGGVFSVDQFLVKYDANGNVMWAKQSATPASNDMIFNSNYVHCDKNGNIYLTGTFWGQVSFDSYTLNTINFNTFLAKYNSDGNVIWAKTTKLPSSASNNVNGGSALDDAGNIYITGYYADTIFGPDFSSRFYLVKYNSNGDSLWAESSTTPDSSDWEGAGLEADSLNNLYLTCFNYPSRSSYVVFGGDTFFTNYISNKPQSLVIKLDDNGHALCGNIIDSCGYNTQVATTTSGKYVYVEATLTDTINIAGDTLESENTEVPIMLRWQACADTDETQPPLNITQLIQLYPNPNNGKLILNIGQLTKGMRVQIFDVLGQEIYSSLPVSNLNNITLENPAAGMYFCRILDKGNNVIYTAKFVVCI